MPINIGGNYSLADGTNSVSGEMDNVEFWNIELSEDAIEQYMNCPPIGSEEGLVGFWKFNEAETSTIVEDQTSFNNHGSIIAPASISVENCPETCSENNQETDNTTVVGDVDCDGDVDMTDAQIIIQLFTGVLDYSEYTQQLECTEDNLTGLMPDQIQEIVDMMEEQLNITGTLSSGLNNGDIIMWNGESWGLIPPGEEGAVLKIKNGIPEWDHSHLIGTEMHGGIVGYLFEPDDPGYVYGEAHGIIITSTSIGCYEWGCFGTSAPPTSLDIGAGLQNSININNENNCNSQAVTECLNFQSNGYDDWFLPSSGEALAIAQNLIENGINLFSFPNPPNSCTLAGQAIWTSTDHNGTTQSKRLDSNYGGTAGTWYISSGNRDDVFRVFPCRYF